MKSISIGKYSITLLNNQDVCDPLSKNRISNCGLLQIKDITEDSCAKMVAKIDQGERYSPDSRYIFLTEYDKKDQLQCGTARAAVMRVIIDKLKPLNLSEYIKINLSK